MPDLPIVGEHVFDWFWELSAGRGSNGFGPSPLTFQEIAAWRDLTGAVLDAWEVTALREMDAAFMTAWGKLKV
jgi:hypothetical protein